MADEAVRELQRQLTEIGALLGVYPEPGSTPASFAQRVKAAVRNTMAAAGITWAEYVCADGAAVFVPAGAAGPRFTVGKGDSLDHLAGQLGMHEAATS